MMTLEQAKEYTREMLEPYYTKEEIEKTVSGQMPLCTFCQSGQGCT